MIDFRLLGTVSLRGHDGAELREVLTQPKRLALLAYLAVAGDWLRRDALLGLFWQEQDATQGRNALRQALHHLRQALGEDAIIARGANEIAVNRDVVCCDATLFQQAVDSNDYAAALELYRGELMPAFFFNGAPVEWDEWLASTRQSLRRKAALAAWRLAADHEAQGDAAESARHARLAAELTPDDEPALRALLTQLLRLGDHAGARHAYESFRRKLARELGVEPSAETRALIKDIPASRAVPPMAMSEPLVSPPISRRADSAGTAAPPPPPARPRSRRGVIIVVTLSALTLALVLIAIPRASGGGHGATPTLRSVAVLPFSDERADSSAGLGVVIADELIASLSRVQGLRVTSRDVNVDAVLRGSVRRADSSTVAHVQLQTLGGDVLWSRSYTGGRALTLALQDSVVSSVIATLAPWLGESAAAHARPPTTNVNAYDFYLRGRALMVTGPGMLPTESGTRAAVRELRQAIALDSNFARAHAALTQAYIQLAEWVRPREILPLARATALRALELDSSDVDTRVALGDVRMIWDRDWKAAEVEYRRAIAGDSTSLRTRAAYGRFLRASRRFDEAVVQERIALALQMAELPDSTVAERERLLDLVDSYERGRLARADSLARVAIAARPGDVRARWMRSMILSTMNRGADAVHEMEQVRRSTGDRLPYLTHLGVAYARAGRPGEARAILAELRRRAVHSYVPRDQLAALSLALGDTTAALSELERAVDEHHWWMYQIVQTPIWTPLHRHPRFLALVDRVGAPRP